MIKFTENTLTIEIKTSSPAEALISIQNNLITLLQSADPESKNDWALDLLKSMTLDVKQIKLSEKA